MALAAVSRQRLARRSRICALAVSLLRIMPPTTGTTPDRLPGNPVTFRSSKPASLRAIMSILPNGLGMLSPPDRVQISSVPVIRPRYDFSSRIVMRWGPMTMKSISNEFVALMARILLAITVQALGRADSAWSAFSSPGVVSPAPARNTFAIVESVHQSCGSGRECSSETRAFQRRFSPHRVRDRCSRAIVRPRMPIWTGSRRIVARNAPNESRGRPPQGKVTPGVRFDARCSTRVTKVAVVVPDFWPGRAGPMATPVRVRHGNVVSYSRRFKEFNGAARASEPPWRRAERS